MDERIERARLLYERAVFTGDPDALAKADLALDAVEADLALARGRIVHTRFRDQRDTDPAPPAEDPAELPLFERAAQLYQALGDASGEAEALFWIGCFYQFVRRDNQTAVPLLNRSLELATQADEKMTMSEALRHLGIEAHSAGRLDLARERLEESNRLRRELGLLAGVASNQVGLAYIAAAQGDREHALALLDEAAATCEATGAHRILHYVNEARAAIAG